MNLTEELTARLPALGHRNWIVIADAAYPLQSAPGIRLLVSGIDHLTALKEAVLQVALSDHVRAFVMLDSEFGALNDVIAPGSEPLRSGVLEVIEGFPRESIPHEEILETLSEAGNSYEVLVIKTSSTVAYSTVFIRLECGYWTPEQEFNLRQRMSRGVTE